MTVPPEWSERDGALEREFAFATFAEAIAFVNRVAELSDAEDHHPDIAVHYRRVVLRCQHRQGLAGVRPQHDRHARAERHACHRQTEPCPLHCLKTGPFAVPKMVCHFRDTTASTKEGLSGKAKIVSNLLG